MELCYSLVRLYWRMEIFSFTKICIVNSRESKAFAMSAFFRLTDRMVAGRKQRLFYIMFTLFMIF